MENSNPLIQPNQQNKKLKRGNSDVDSSDTEEEISVPIILNNWPRFMLIQSVDPERPIAKLSLSIASAISSWWPNMTSLSFATIWDISVSLMSQLSPFVTCKNFIVNPGHGHQL